MKYPVHKPIVGLSELELLKQCIETGWISSDGPFVKEFEERFSNFIGVTNGVAVSNGTAALTAAMYGIGLSKGDEVILPSFTIISCVVGVVRFGAIPVLVDIEPETWNVNVDLIEAKITSKTKAIIAVHMYGHPCDMDAINLLAKKYNLKVIEDASQVHGAIYKGSKCGSLGDVSTFSFYANKILTTGEGGMVLSSDPNIINRVRDYRNLCFDAERKYIHDDFGDNLRMTNMQAALGLAQLKNIDAIIKKKIENGLEYQKNLKDVPQIKLQVEKPWAKMVYWMYCVQFRVDFNINIDMVKAVLTNMGVGSRYFFTGLHKQPALANLGYQYDSNDFKITECASKYGLYLPSSTDLGPDDIKYICDSLKSAIND